ncbi:hypothetical protein [Viridibacillus arvi]|uniref:hypothetical protein n=1 Tax=Viridibacillus arvi TaxID=263475 RepID=UPI0034CD3109
METKINIPSPKFLKELSEERFKNYEKEVLEGPLFKRIITNIEESALKGFKGWKQRLDSHDDFRALKVICKQLSDQGFYSDFETVDVNGLVGNYKQQYFVVRWGEAK